MEMGTIQSLSRSARTSSDESSRFIGVYDRISNRKRKWNLTNYGKSLRKRKNNTSCFKSETKIIKTKIEDDNLTINTNVVEYSSTSTSFMSCCPSTNNYSLKDFHFTLASYNILAPDLAQENNYLYKNVPNDFLNWYYRRHQIYNEVKYFDFDIYCFQEMQENEYFDYFYPKFKSLGYYCLFKKRTGDKPDGCALIFKKRKFRLVSFELIEYFSPNVETLSKENVAIIAMLSPKYGPINEKICVVTTHLIFSPKRGDVKLAQLQKLLANIDRIAYKCTKLVNNEIKLVYYPIILCGDMNLTLNSTIYKFLTESKLLNYEQHARTSVSGQVKRNSSTKLLLNRPLIPENMEINDYSIYNSEINKRLNEIKIINDEKLNSYNLYGSENLYHTFKFKSAYDLECFNNDSLDGVTTCLPHNHEKVDFIFFHNDQDFVTEEINDEITNDKFDGNSYLELVSVLKLYNKNDVENLYFPSKYIPSDHFLLSAKFSLLYK